MPPNMTAGLSSLDKSHPFAGMVATTRLVSGVPCRSTYPDRILSSEATAVSSAGGTLPSPPRKGRNSTPATVWPVRIRKKGRTITK